MRLFLSIAVVLGSVLLLPTPAHANPITDHATSPHDDLDFKVASVTCSSGKVVAMGGSVSDLFGNVVLTAVTVDAALSTVTAIGHARPGFDGAWSVTAQVACGPADVFEPVREVGGGQGTAMATCDDDKVLYSSGYRIADPDGSQYVDHLVPSADLTEVGVHAGTTGAGPVSVAAYAICGKPSYDKLRLQDSTGRNPANPKYADVLHEEVVKCIGCSYVFGGGFAIDSLRPAFATGFGPNSALDGARARAAIAATSTARALTATDEEDWELTVYGDDIGAWSG